MIKKIKEPPVYTGKPAVTNTELQNIFKVADRSDLNKFYKLIENAKEHVANQIKSGVKFTDEDYQVLADSVNLQLKNSKVLLVQTHKDMFKYQQNHPNPKVGDIQGLNPDFNLFLLATKQRNKEKDDLLFKTTNLTPNDERLVGLNEEDITKIKNVIDYSNSISKYFKDKSKKNEILPRDLNTIIDRNNTKLNKEGLSDKFHYVLNRPTTSYGDSISNKPILCLERKPEPVPVPIIEELVVPVMNKGKGKEIDTLHENVSDHDPVMNKGKGKEKEFISENVLDIAPVINKGKGKEIEYQNIYEVWDPNYKEKKIYSAPTTSTSTSNIDYYINSVPTTSTSTSNIGFNTKSNIKNNILSLTEETRNSRSNSVSSVKSDSNSNPISKSNSNSNPISNTNSISISKNNNNTDSIINNKPESVINIKSNSNSVSSIKSESIINTDPNIKSRSNSVSSIKSESVYNVRPESISNSNTNPNPSTNPISSLNTNSNTISKSNSVSNPNPNPNINSDSNTNSNPNLNSISNSNVVSRIRNEAVSSVRPEVVSSARPESVSTVRPITFRKNIFFKKENISEPEPIVMAPRYNTGTIMHDWSDYEFWKKAPWFKYPSSVKSDRTGINNNNNINNNNSGIDNNNNNISSTNKITPIKSYANVVKQNPITTNSNTNKNDKEEPYFLYSVKEYDFDFNFNLNFDFNINWSYIILIICNIPRIIMFIVILISMKREIEIWWSCFRYEIYNCPESKEYILYKKYITNNITYINNLYENKFNYKLYKNIRILAKIKKITKKNLKKINRLYLKKKFK